MPSAPVNAFLARFDKVKATGGQHLVVCPAHADKSPSLAIKEGSDGAVLLKCHAGCPTDAILAAMNLEASALFEQKDQPKRTIQHEYAYHDENGQLLFQCVRFLPKGFSQRRPDGKNGWIYNLQGVRRVVYRLPELLGQKAILFVEGEKDVDKAWSLGLPATTSPMGAGKWDRSYAEQLKTAGVQRVAVIPDNDPVGAAHATTVTAGLQAVGIEVRLLPLPGVPEHGDLSDYLAQGHSKDELLALVRATPPADRVLTPTTVTQDGPDRQFAPMGERRYQLTIRSKGIVIDVSDLHRSTREGLSGQLLVRVNGSFPEAKTHKDGILSVGDFNFSSVQARSTRAKLLAERAGDREFDWYGLLEEFVVEVISHQDQGEPPVILGAGDDVDLVDDAPAEVWDVDGLPILISDPMVLFGDSASGKSYLALWIAGVLADRGVKVLYIDWEFSEREHRKRLRRLFQPTPKTLHYIRSDEPITREHARISRLIADHGYQYLICDSIGFAVDGPAEAHDSARGYFAALRMMGVGSLSLAHIAKNRDDGREATIFGSAFFKAGARSAWFVDRAAENAEGELNIGLHHRKSNSSGLLRPLAFKFSFTKHRVSVERTDISKVESLVSQLPLVERLKRHMRDGEFYAYKDLAEDLVVPAETIRKALSRSKHFQKINRKVRYAPADEPPEDHTMGGTVIHHEF